MEALAVEHKTFSSYEAELFPGLIYRMVKPKVVLLIFVSGKLVLTGICLYDLNVKTLYLTNITGAKLREEINEAFNNIYPVLEEFKKK